MSLYSKTYNSIIETFATSIYNKVNSKSAAITANSTFRTLTTTHGLQNITQTQGTTNVANVVTTEKVSSAYAKPTAVQIKNDITTFVKNTLTLTDERLKQNPNGADMVGFIFALNYFLERSLTKVVNSVSGSTNNTTIIYTPVTSGYKNQLYLNLNSEVKANRITKEDIDKIYATLQTVGGTENTGLALTTSASTTSSSSSSSSSSSCSSSCSSSSSSSSSRFIAYFNLG